MDNKEEDYTLNSYKDIRFNNGDVLFAKDCIFGSLINSDGLFIDKKFVSAVVIEDKQFISIYLKGTKKDFYNKKISNKILWKHDGED